MWPGQIIQWNDKIKEVDRNPHGEIRADLVGGGKFVSANLIHDIGEYGTIIEEYIGPLPNTNRPGPRLPGKLYSVRFGAFDVICHELCIEELCRGGKEIE